MSSDPPSRSSSISRGTISRSSNFIFTPNDPDDFLESGSRNSSRPPSAWGGHSHSSPLSSPSQEISNSLNSNSSWPYSSANSSQSSVSSGATGHTERMSASGSKYTAFGMSAGNTG